MYRDVVIEKVQELIRETPVHPLYDVVVNVEASRNAWGEIILGWRGAVQWDYETMRAKYEDMRRTARYDQEVEAPVWGENYPVSAGLLGSDLTGVWAVARKHLDYMFLDKLEKEGLPTGIVFMRNRWMKHAR